MRITDPLAANIVLHRALETGPARVVTTAHGSQELTVLGDAVHWPDIRQPHVAYHFRYLPDSGRAWLACTQVRGQNRQPVTGEGCDHHGLPLSGLNASLAAALIHRADGRYDIVRGNPSVFDGFRSDILAAAATPPPLPGTPPDVVPVVWQWCLGDRDITADYHAQNDADQVRVWDGDFCVMVLRRDPLNHDVWRYGTSDAPIPDDLARSRFRDPDNALRLISALHGRLYTANPDAAGCGPTP